LPPTLQDLGKNVCMAFAKARWDGVAHSTESMGSFISSFKQFNFAPNIFNFNVGSERSPLAIDLRTKEAA